MGRTKTPIDVQKQMQVGHVETADITDLVTKIVKGDVVLVLGREHLLRDDLNDGDVVRQITQEFFEDKKEKDPNFNSSYPTFNEYCYWGADSQKLRMEVAQFLSSSYSFDEGEMSPLIVELLRRKYFRVVMTTTFDYYLETLLRKIWGKELRVLNIYEKQNDIEDEESWRNDMRPTLYYIFGKADKVLDYTVVEKDAMKVIQSWLGSKAPKNFTNFLKEKTILAIGTKFDDWLFRFFWLSMQRDLSELRNGQVAISLNPESEVDSKLKKFLNGEQIQNNSIENVVQTILGNYEIKEQEYRNVRGSYTDIFISYPSESYETVKHLFYALENRDLKVWFDKKSMNYGDGHEQVILNAIGQCRVFIPVITKAAIKVLNEGLNDSSHYFRDVEWRAAMSRASMDGGEPFKVVPIFMEGLSVKDFSFDETQKDFKDFIMSKSCFDNITKAKFDNFVNVLKPNR